VGGPAAPLSAVGAGLGLLTVRLVRKDAPPEMGALLAAAGTFAGISFLFGSPLIGAVILIEAAGLGGPRLPLVLIPGLLAAGIGSLVSIGMGSWTGLSTSNISLGTLALPAFDRPDLVDFAWTIPLAAAIAAVTFAIFALARQTVRVARPHPYLLLPAIGIAVSGLAIAFHAGSAGTWSLSALALLIAFKGLAYALSLGSFRGGPTFPAMFLGAAAGLMAAQLPGFEITPAVAVSLGAAVVAVLRLPLAAVVLATLFTFKAGLGVGPLIIVGVVVAHLTVLALSPLERSEGAENEAQTGAPAQSTA
jgi:H+/Cl- antiporter ClcA